MFACSDAQYIFKYIFIYMKHTYSDAVFCENRLVVINIQYYNSHLPFWRIL